MLFSTKAEYGVRLMIELGRQELNHTRARLGLPPLDYVHGGISRQLALVATFSYFVVALLFPLILRLLPGTEKPTEKSDDSEHD